MEGKQNSFPVVRVKAPLCDIPRSSEIWKKLGFDEQGKRRKASDNKIRLSVLTEALRDSKQLSGKRNQQLLLRLRNKAEELLQHTNDNRPEGAVLQEFAQSFQKAVSDPHILLRAIAERALQDMQHARLDDLATVEILLVGKGPPNDRDPQPQMTVQLAFDLHDDHSLPQRLYSQKVRDYVKRILPLEQEEGSRSRNSKSSHPARVCAFTGEEQPLQITPFPQVKLPVLNKDFPLFSMFSDAECNKRYGLTDALIVPVATKVALGMQDALTWIVAPERKGKTWRSVASGKFEIAQGRKRECFDLLVVYVDGKPDINANIADLFGTDEGEQQKQFEVDAKAVCKALDGIVRVQPGSKLNLFLLRKASEGQAHVAVAESPLVEDVLRAAQRWQQASANVPEVTLPLPGEKGEHNVPYPDQVVRLLSEEWVTNGIRSNKVNSIGLGEVLDLMLQKPGKWEYAAQRMLDLTVRRLSPLLLGVFGAIHTNDMERWEHYPVRSREIALRAVSTLGILLDAIGHRKEMYMSGTAFLVGRLLSLADTLHREYCKHVRGGDIPPQLIGNGLMPAAADNPKDAVDRLRERMMPYKAWADKGDGEETRLAKWAVGQMGQVCQRLSELELSPETDQAFRAELFLGYMARPPADQRQFNEMTHNTQENTNVE
jgi:hypothetical protein